MAEKLIKIKSLNEHVVESIKSVLWSESFPACDLTPNGILILVDEIASYHEEGKELFPHILLTVDLEKLLNSIPFTQKVIIKKNSLTLSEFKSALKLCAPLAVDGWIIYIEVKISETKIEFGLLSSEVSETSPSLHRQLLGDLASECSECPFIYISNIGQRTVLIEGTKSRIAVSLNLKAVESISSGSVGVLASYLAKETKPEIKDTVSSYFEKLLNYSLKECHGTLIGIVEDNEDAIESLKEIIDDAVYLQNPIDLSAMIETSESEKSREASSLVRIYSSILQNMLNLDGITILTTKGRIVAYHCFIKQEGSQETPGGARVRAFEAMSHSKAFAFCLYKSQDGNEKIWSKND